jgi:putative flippase GtrA
MSHQHHLKHEPHHHNHSVEEHPYFVKAQKASTLKLAVSATLHCLLGCGIGEVVGVIIGTYLGWGIPATMTLAIILGFIFGFLLGIIPLLRKGFTIMSAFKIVFAAEFLSIAVMEAFEVAAQLVIPGVMEAGLNDALFWIGMLAALTVGFIAAFPVNYYMIKQGVRHQH